MVQGAAKAATNLVPNACKGMREMLLIRFAGHFDDPNIVVAATSAFDNVLNRAVAGKRALPAAPPKNRPLPLAETQTV